MCLIRFTHHILVQRAPTDQGTQIDLTRLGNGASIVTDNGSGGIATAEEEDTEAA